MSRFYVGQRVRLARPLYPENFGVTGVITHFEMMRKGTPLLDGPLQSDSDCGVLWDGETVFCWQSVDQLEPILYDGNQLVSWESCLWQPEGQAA